MSWLNHPITYVTLACVLLQTLAWNRQRKTNNADTVDIAWTLGIIVCALIYMFLIPADDLTMLVVFVFPIVW